MHVYIQKTCPWPSNHYRGKLAGGEQPSHLLFASAYSGTEVKDARRRALELKFNPNTPSCVDMEMGRGQNIAMTDASGFKDERSSVKC